MRALRDLPNRSGFKFLGILKDGTFKECEIEYGSEKMTISCGRGNSSTEFSPNTYYVTGTKYEDLVGWCHIYERNSHPERYEFKQCTVCNGRGYFCAACKAFGYVPEEREK